MNRLAPMTLPMASPTATPSDTVAFAGEPRVRLLDPCESLPPVARFVPMHYEANYAYPLVVWLHGAGQSQQDLPMVMRHISTRNYLGAAPQGMPCETGEGLTWHDDPTGIEEAEQRVFDAVAETAEQLNVHPQRVFLAGVGAGGTTALRVALAHPHAFAGAASFMGPLPTGRGPLRRINDLRNLPLLVASTRESVDYPEARLCKDLRLLHSAGASLSIRQYPGADDLATGMLEDFDRWLMEIVCGATANV